MLALLPMAATGSGNPSPRPSPSKRQDTWGVMASYIDNTGASGWGKPVEGICSGMLWRCWVEAKMTAMKGNEEQKWVRAPTSIAAASAGEDAIEH